MVLLVLDWAYCTMFKSRSSRGATDTRFHHTDNSDQAIKFNDDNNELPVRRRVLSKWRLDVRGSSAIRSFRMSLMSHLLSDYDRDNDNDDDNDGATLLDSRSRSEEVKTATVGPDRSLDGEFGSDFAALTSSSDDAGTVATSKKLLCRRFRFLRAFQCLLMFSYETLTEQALQLVNCISVGSCGRVLAEYPDITCPDNVHYIPLLLVAVLILVYAAAFPIGLFVTLRKQSASTLQRGQIDASTVTDHGSEHNQSSGASCHRDVALTAAKFGVFYDHFKSQFWWWEIQVSAK